MAVAESILQADMGSVCVIDTTVGHILTDTEHHKGLTAKPLVGINTLPFITVIFTIC